MITQQRNTNDTQLLTRIVQRDLSALEQFYDRYSEIVYGLIFQIVQDRTLADELLQETFLQVWSQADSISDEVDGALWLYQLARRRSLDALRWSQSNPQLRTTITERVRQQALTPEQDLDAYFPRNAVLVDFTDKIVQTQRKDAWKAFQAMSAEQRICVSLAFFVGLTDQEIADYVNLPVNWVKSLIADGVARVGKMTAVAGEKERLAGAVLPNLFIKEHA